MSGRPTTTETLPEDTEVWFVSDLHLGDGTASDAFFGKDHHLIALVETVERRGATLVIGGDAMDFQQAWSFTRILRAHQELLSAFSRLARERRLVYVIGNHDYDLSMYREILSFRVCDELRIGSRILVQHGMQYDPFIQKELSGGQLSTKLHHLVERYLNTWLRIPLGEFYTRGNRLMFWMVHKFGLGVRAYAATARLFGLDASAANAERFLNFWARSNMGDPMCIFKPIMKKLDEGEWQYIVCGHSHLPGVVQRNGRAYVNTGSWTFASSHYVVWDGQQIACRDWITGRSFAAEFYQPLIDGTIDEKDFWQWWRENYMGLFRYREGEERRGRLRGWEAYIRDYQYLSQLHPAPMNPLRPADEPEPVD